MLDVCRMCTEGNLLYKVTISHSTNYIRRVWHASIYAAETQQQLREPGVMPNRKVEKDMFLCVRKIAYKKKMHHGHALQAHTVTLNASEMKWLGASEHSDHDASSTLHGRLRG